MIVFGALDPLDRRQLVKALDLLARHLRSDGLPMTPTLRQMYETITVPDSIRQEPTILDEPRACPDDGLVLFDLNEIADRLGVTRRTVEREIKAGRLAPVHIGKACRVSPTDLAEYIATQRQPVAPCHGDEPAGRRNHGLGAGRPNLAHEGEQR